MNNASLTLRMAFRLAWSTDRSQSWRKWSILLGTALSAFLLTGAAAVIIASFDSDARDLARRPTLTSEPEGAPLRLVPRANFWDGRQFPVIWLDGDASSPLPPGLESLPEPGTVVVSPAIADAPGVVEALGYSVSSVGSGERGVIGDDGLVARSEWLVYARADRTLGVEGNVVGVTGFGRTDGNQSKMDLRTDPAMPSGTVAVTGLLWLLAIPCVLLTTLVASSHSALRRTRVQTLLHIGLSPGTAAAVSAIETAWIAVPGSAIGAVAWVAVAPSIHDLPGTGIVVTDGALGTDPWIGIPVALLVAGIACGVGALSGNATLRARRVRPAVAERWARGTASIPLALGMLGMVAARFVGPPNSVVLLFATLILCTLALPLASPAIVYLLGSQVAMDREAHRWLAGRRLQFSPRSLARPAMGVGALVLVTGSLTGLYMAQTAVVQDGTEGAYSTGWRTPKPGDVQLVRDRLPDAVVASFDARGTVWFLTCDDVAVALGREGCSAYGSTHAATQAFAEAVGYEAAVGEMPDQSGYSQEVLVFGDETTLNDVQAAVASLPAGNTDVLRNATIRAPLSIAWLAAAGLVSAFVLVLVALHSFANRALGAFGEDLALLALGLDVDQVRRVQRWTLAVPIVVTIPTATLVSMVFTWSASASEVAMTAFAQITVEALAIALLSLGVMAAVMRIGGSRVEGRRPALRSRVRS